MLIFKKSIQKIELVVRIDADGAIIRHQPTRSSAFEIGRVGNEIQVFIQNVSFVFFDATMT